MEVRGPHGRAGGWTNYPRLRKPRRGARFAEPKGGTAMVIVTGVYDDNGQMVGMLVRCDYAHNSRVKSVPGYRWDPETRGWRFRLDADALRALKMKLPGMELAPEVQQWWSTQSQREQGMLAIKGQQDASLKSGLAPRLFGYQRVGVRFLTEAKRVILADDMGLGKTLQVIAACEELQARRILVVCPNSLKGNWEREIAKWTPQRRVTVLRGSTRAAKEKVLAGYEGDYLVVNYEVTRRGGMMEDLGALQWDVMVVDEAHNVKNRKAQQTQGIKQLTKRAECVFMLTGTPIMNRVEELWSPLNMLYPARYGSFWGFAKQHTWVSQGRYGWEIDGRPRNPYALRQELAPIMLRREKEEVFPDMPPKVYQTLWVELEGEQKRIYNEVENMAMTQVTEDTLVITPGVLAQITRCKQIAISPGLIGGEREGVKLDALMEVLQGTERKVIVFSQFAQAVFLASERLDRAGIKHVVLTGATPEDERVALVDKFQTDPETRVFVATTQLGGVGLTLTAASMVVFLDKHWTPAINEQAVDRTRPHLQKESVQVISILAQDTVDEMIEDVLDGKMTIVEAVIAKKREREV